MLRAAGFDKAGRMTRIRNFTAVLTASASLLASTGCTNDQPPRQSYPIAPISGPEPVDGTYNGLKQLLRGDETSCGNTDEFHLQISGRQFTYRLLQPQADWRPVIVFGATIAPDGTFNAVSGDSFMRGTLKQGHIHGEMSGDVCGFSFDADRTGTW